MVKKSDISTGDSKRGGVYLEENPKAQEERETPVIDRTDGLLHAEEHATTFYEIYTVKPQSVRIYTFCSQNLNLGFVINTKGGT